MPTYDYKCRRCGSINEYFHHMDESKPQSSCCNYDVVRYFGRQRLRLNLDINPYFDDFSEKNVGARDKNYYKVLFNPGRAIQARELNTLQSILRRFNF